MWLLAFILSSDWLIDLQKSLPFGQWIEDLGTFLHNAVEDSFSFFIFYEI